MQIDIVTLFPEMYTGPFNESIIGKAIKNNIVDVKIHNLRDWGIGKYNQVDDTPFGGGAGMVIMIEPVHNCIKDIKAKAIHTKPKVIALSAKGETLIQSKVKTFSEQDHLILLAGHYEGFDQRILDNLVDETISIGNFVLTGGELPSMILTDSIVRLLPDVLGNNESPISDSFYEDDTSIQYPQYTRPAEFTTKEGSIFTIPDILTSGHHKNIEDWRKNNTQ